MQSIEVTPNIINLDGIPTFTSQILPDDPLNDMLIITRNGVLWIIDFSDKVSL